MEQLKQILQLKNDGTGIREIARSVGISRNSVGKYLPLPDSGNEELTSKALAELNTQKHQQLFQHVESAQSELSKTGVTRQQTHIGKAGFCQ